MMRHTKTLLAALLAVTACFATGCLEEPIEEVELETEERWSEEPHELLDDAACDGYDVGDSFEPDSCNVCLCTEEGLKCTKEQCEDGSTHDYLGAATESCGDNELGEMWQEGCNTCLCGPLGPECTRKECNAH